MYITKTVLQKPQKIKFLQFNSFSLRDHELVQKYIDEFQPLSCEYNFSNLFAWQGVHRLLWTLYQERLLIYDNLSQRAFMPLGKVLYPEELVILSLNLENIGLKPGFGIVRSDYLRRFPDIEKYYIIKKERDYAEYIYDVNTLCDLTGIKLHKKRNLISQFKRRNPDFKVHLLNSEHRQKALKLAQAMATNSNKRSTTLDQELCAIKVSFDNFEQLKQEGLAITIETRLAAFSVFSALNHSTYDIQFEKSDPDFKGAAQVINHETAKYLKDKCQYINREQDLGIKGLRQAKMSYEPESLLMPHSLIFTPPN